MSRTGSLPDFLLSASPSELQYGIPDDALLRKSADFAVDEDNFLSYAGPAAGGAQGGYTVDDNGAAATVALQSALGGRLRMTTANNNGVDDCVIRRGVNQYLYQANKRLGFRCRFLLEDVDLTQLFMGFGTSGADPLDSLPSDGIFISKAATATDLTYQVRQNGTSTSGTLGVTLADGTNYVLEIVVGTDGTIRFLLDEVQYATVASTDANVPNAAADLMDWMIGIETGAAATKYIEIDSVRVVQEI